MTLYLGSLRAHQQELDSLNVYPVPDGDTGTNMLLTQEAVDAALASAAPDAELPTLAEVIAHASLMGARGNSGVILSQVLRGMCRRLPPGRPADGLELAAALESAAKDAYAAVARPVEGTILSVLRDAASAAARAASDGRPVEQVGRAALEASRVSLATTKDALPELQRAGVVDAGAKGIVLLLDALHAALRGESVSEPIGELGPVGADRSRTDWGDGFTQEVQYLLEASEESIPELRQALSKLGDSVVVVGGGGLFGVHVHTDRPDEAVAAGRAAGVLRRISVLRLADRRGDCLGVQARAMRVAEPAPCAMVVVAEGQGLGATFESLGALVVAGERRAGRMPTELIVAIDLVAADAVVVIVGFDDEARIAERAAVESAKEVEVVGVRAAPSGLAAAASFNPTRSLDENAKAMRAAAVACRCGEIRAASGGEEHSGGWLGLAEGREIVLGAALEETAVCIARCLADARSELLTVVTGDGAESEESTRVVRALREAFVDLEVQVVDGGQPQPLYLIGVE
jgi:DAK2 domain fusion protein YloV